MSFNDHFNDHFLENDDDKTEHGHVETEQEREEREIEESTISRRRNSLRMVLLSSIFLLAAILTTWGWLHYYRPSLHSVEKGWVMNVTNEGTLFKTFECKMITQDLILDSINVKFAGDTVLVDGCDFMASIPNDSLAREAVKWKATGKRVVVEYDEYSGALPWRGNTSRLVTNIYLDPQP